MGRLATTIPGPIRSSRCFGRSSESSRISRFTSPGRIVRLDERSFEVIGVMPRDFPGLSGAAEIWVPAMVTEPSDLDHPQAHSFSVVARLASDTSRDQARSAVLALGERVHRAFPSRLDDGEPGARPRAR
ncbi:MAG: hypothetical protein GEU90_13155 [Gemmatimonas sp.]|nr:hypothetical protein [Gemmatimonas sp.]